MDTAVGLLTKEKQTNKNNRKTNKNKQIKVLVKSKGLRRGVGVRGCSTFCGKSEGTDLETDLHAALFSLLVQYLLQAGFCSVIRVI